jgi:hypothetical protein
MVPTAVVARMNDLRAMIRPMVEKDTQETEVLFDFLIEMELQFAVHLPLDRVAAQQGPQPQAHDIEPPFELHNVYSSAMRITSPTAPDRRSHCASSFSSCARPAAVSV